MANIRQALPSDAAALCELNALFNGEGLAGIEEIAESLLRNKGEVVIVAYEGKQAVGFCCGQVTHSMCYRHPLGELTEMYVRNGFRRMGIGRAMMAALEAELKALGVAEMRLLTGHDNEKARLLYRAAGYMESDEVLMEKEL